MKKVLRVIAMVVLISFIMYMPFLIHFEVATISQVIKALLLLLAFNTALHVL